jgi:hypothetical protein
MKKFLLASLFASVTTPVLVGVGLNLVATPAALAQAAQGSSDLTIKDPAEYNAYQNAHTQTTPAAKISACEAFLKQYPNSILKKTILDDLVDAYAQVQPNDPNKTIDAAQRMLQVDPNNLKSMYIIALLKKQQAAATPAQAGQLLDDAAAMATKGLAATKPADVKQDEWDKQQAATGPLFYSILANDQLYGKKDMKAAVDAFRTELEYLAKNNPDATKSAPGLNDTLLLGQTYTQLTPPDMVNAVWFLTRAENFAPAGYKPQIDKQARYWYKRFHGKEDGFEAVLTASATSIFPPPDFKIDPAPTPKDIADGVVASTPDLSTLALQDKEYILANASKDNADKLWATLKDQVTQIPGTVMSVSDDGTQVKIAVTDDAKADKKPDFTINLKKPLTAAEKTKLAVGTDETNLIGTFDSYTQNPEEIIMRDGELQVEKKTPARKPSAAHPRASSSN